jgi:hypothetical protein
VSIYYEAMQYHLIEDWMTIEIGRDVENRMTVRKDNMNITIRKEGEKAGEYREK